MQYSIDRFEEGFAVCEREDGRFCQIAKTDLPPCAREGSILTYADGVWALDLQAERQRRNMLFEWQDDLFS
ncbi:MAG: DUF3006 domain-containing protein [Oscillospiraceae bacterium]|nr:DUF3006 domain-containing protein [Oscillospiraceae bacterium]